MIKPYIHPATPPKLARAFRNAKNGKGEGYKYHVLAERLGVNTKPLHDLIHYGKEPTDRTAKGREIRKRLFLRRYKRRQKKENQVPFREMPAYLKWWRSIKKERRHKCMAYCFVNFSMPEDTQRFIKW